MVSLVDIMHGIEEQASFAFCIKANFVHGCYSSLFTCYCLLSTTHTLASLTPSLGAPKKVFI
jgi:hypothetical protein